MKTTKLTIDDIKKNAEAEYKLLYPYPEYVNYDISVPAIEDNKWKSFYREVAKKIHPDSGGNAEHMAILSELNRMMTSVQKQQDHFAQTSKWSKEKDSYCHAVARKEFRL